MVLDGLESAEACISHAYGHECNSMQVKLPYYQFTIELYSNGRGKNSNKSRKEFIK